MIAKVFHKCRVVDCAILNISRNFTYHYQLAVPDISNQYKKYASIFLLGLL